MSDKYIVKNCPCIIEFKNMYFCAELNNVDKLKQTCQDCTDCLIKQAIEKCKEARRTGRKAYLPLDILDLFDIEECECNEEKYNE